MSSIQHWHKQAQIALNQQNYKAAHQHCMAIIRQQPHHADAHFLLGMIAFSMQQMGKAIGLIEHAIKLAPDKAEYHAHLARSLAMLNRHTDASNVVQQAVDLAPKDALTLDTIGVVYSRIGQHEKAISFFSRCCQLKPDNPGYWYNLAASQRFCGLFSDAEQSYENVIRLSPGYYPAHSALADVAKITQDNNHIARLNQLKNQAGMSTDAQVHLGHALLKEHEALGEYDAAFAALSHGNEQKKQQLNYHRAQDQALFDGIIEAFSQQPIQTCASDNDEAIFVVGMPRSGTTLVDRILSSHSDVMSAGELQNFAVEMKRASATPSNQVLDVSTINAATQLDSAKLGERYIDSTRPLTGSTRHFVDKMPLNFFHLGFIHQALPKAKLICLSRNAMDTCVSNFRQLFALNFSYYNYSYDLLDTGHYFLQFKRLMAFWQQQLKDKLYVVEYEKLVANPEAEIAALLNFCELPWQDACLNFHQNSAAVATASTVQVRQPMNSKSIGRWKKYQQQTLALQELFDANHISY